MSTPKSFPLVENPLHDTWQSPSAKASRKLDAGFADLLEFRGKMSRVPTTPALTQPSGSIAHTSGIAGRLQAGALATLAKVFNTPDAGETAAPGSLTGIGMRGLQGVRALAGDKAALVLKKPASGGTGEVLQGIALPDTGKGIPLSADQRRILSRVTTLTPLRDPLPLRAVSRPSRVSRRAAVLPQTDVGTLAARFESGSEGIAAIGYDRNGGTSYGKYQIASRPGTMAMFLDFLKKEEPAMAKRLSAAGPANTGSRKGAMPRVWRELAAESPERFEELQERFIRRSHYEPALASLERMGYDTDNFSSAMREVVFSTAVQHGPGGATRIFSQAAEQVGLASADPRRQEEHLIRKVYAIRSSQFGSSSPQVQAAARRRMAQEQELVMALSREKAVA